MIENYSELSNASSFIRKLVISAQPIYVAHMEIMKDNNYNIDFTELGSTKEKLIKSITDAFGGINNYFDDLYKTLNYLKIDKRKIQHLYSNTISSEDYYKYHYDNFIIRIMTSFDICGKLGNIVYQLGIQEKYANGSSFINHPDIKDLEPAEKGVKLFNFLDEFRQQRHHKIHKGENSSNRFDKIVFWDTINKIVGAGEPTSQVLEDYTQDEIIALIDSMEPKLDEIISSN